MTRKARQRAFAAHAALALIVAGVLAAGAVTAAAAGSAASPGSCRLGMGGKIRHVIYIQFDNTHYTRDNPNVPSDLQQMPNLLNFLTGNGTLLTHEHTPLIAHTANDIVTSESGLYGSEHGMPIANEYQYYKPDGTTDTAGSFAYWTDPIVDYNTGHPVGDHTPTMVGPTGKIAPAPWVPYTRAGCNFGTVAGANTELENTLPDVPHVFGQHSPEAREARNPKLQNKAAADFMGLVVHCARGSATCDRAHGGRPDVLKSEPGGYHGFRALYGYKFVQPAISPSGPVRSLGGKVIKDSSGDIGFPGYNAMTGPNALALTLDMQLHGVAVTDTYMSDLHESWVTGGPFGPGQPGYERQLKAENAAFGTFFSRLAAHGITTKNTLFVVTADEGDHFVGSAATPAGCNGVHIVCHYKRIGEVNGNLTGLLAAKGISAKFDVGADSAPAIYVHGQPGRATRAVRALERATARLTGHDLATGQHHVRLTNYMADPVELKILHMVTGDPKRTPTLVMFGNTDFWLTSGPAKCGASCFTEPAGTDAWNHGTVGSQINTTWLGLAGPGVARLGVDNAVWSDHTNIQPTMMALLGLRDDYAPDGRVLAEVIAHSSLPAGMRAHLPVLLRLGRAYTAIEAPVGPFGLATLRASTEALASATRGDSRCAATESALARLGAARDRVAGQMRTMLDGAAFAGKPVNVARANALIRQARRLQREADLLAH